MRHTYGKTFWGQQWLNAFNGIDYSNRLPRGRTYANKGAVFDIDLTSERFSAKVQGSRRLPYRIHFAQPAFSAHEKKAILKTIRQSPFIFSQLMNRQLPEALLDTLASIGIYLFPKSWNDLNAACNCPDWAVPCKHLAAGIYLMANRIDQNPFLVFDNRGFDLQAAIKDTGLLKTEACTAIPSVKARLFSPSHMDKDFHSDECLTSIEATIDFSKLPDLTDKLQTLLKAEPVFYAGNFKQVIFERFKQVKRLSERTSAMSPGSHKIAKALSQQLGNTEPWRFLHLVVTEQMATQKLYNQDGRLFDPKTMDSQQPAQGILDQLLVDMLLLLPVEAVALQCQTLRYLHLVHRFVLKLLERSAIVPEICQAGENHWLIRWLPALFDEAVTTQFEKLVALCPEQWLSIKTKTAFLTRYQQTLVTCSLFIGHYLRQSQFLSTKRMANPYEAINTLFFTQVPVALDQFDQQDTPDAIAHWLERLVARKSNRYLQLQVNEKGDAFSIGLQVAGRDKKNRAIGLKTFLKKADTPNSDEARDKSQVLSDLALLCDYLPAMATVVDDSRNRSLNVDLDTFSPILLGIMPALKVLGMGVTLPKSLQKLLKPSLKLQLSADKSLNSEKSYLHLDELLTFDWRISLGDKSMEIDAFKRLLEESRGLVRLMDGYVLLDELEIEDLLKQLDNLPTELNSSELLQASLAGHYDGAMVSNDPYIQNFLERITSYTAVRTPKRLKATLRPYQRSGFSWMVQNATLGFGSLLADDMGLGKTVQVIAVLLHFKMTKALDTKKVLVVAPTSLLSNWQKEIEKFAPDLSVSIYHGQKRDLSSDFDVLVTSYGLARRDKNKINALQWHVLVIDEAQQIKNPQSAQTKSIKSIKADHRIAMSGTPVENRLMEYWSLFDFTNTGYLGAAKQFKKSFATPIENDRDQECLDRFHKITSPFILRRLKSDKRIIQDLPEKIDSDLICSLTKEQTALYQEVVDQTLERIENTNGIERKGLVFKLINALKQICNHPAHYLKEHDAVIKQSGKLIAACDLLDAIHEQSEKTLIFTQYKQMGDLLASVLTDRFNQSVPFLHGGLNMKKRDQMVNDFQHESQVKILIVSLKAGGTGLNLTAANHVIHYDLWWNPAVEAQATDRAYRIGQKKNVQVHRLICEGTFEEKINAMINDKQALADLSVSSGETWLTEFDNTELRQLFAQSKS